MTIVEPDQQQAPAPPPGATDISHMGLEMPAHGAGAARPASVFGRPDWGRGVDAMGGPDPAGCLDAMGGPDAAEITDVMGGPDRAPCPDVMGGPDAPGTVDVMGGPDPARSTPRTRPRAARRLPGRGRATLETP